MSSAVETILFCTIMLKTDWTASCHCCLPYIVQARHISVATHGMVVCRLTLSPFRPHYYHGGLRVSIHDLVGSGSISIGQVASKQTCVGLHTFAKYQCEEVVDTGLKTIYI